MEFLKAPFTLAKLFALKLPDDAGEVQGFSQLPGHKHLLPHHLAAMGPGSQYPVKGNSCIQRCFDNKLFVTQCLTRSTNDQ